MSKDSWIRLWMHVPWGMLAVFPLSWWLFVSPDTALIVALIGITASIVAFLGMIGYEAFNDWRKKDWSYKDVLGICWGWLIGMLILAGVLIRIF